MQCLKCRFVGSVHFTYRSHTTFFWQLDDLNIDDDDSDNDNDDDEYLNEDYVPGSKTSEDSRRRDGEVRSRPYFFPT